jgi:predicted phosphoribosyltransferase
MRRPPRSALQRLARALRDRQVWRRTLFLGLPVGALQATLNQGDHWYNHAVDTVVVLKTILSPTLSCAIAFVSAALAQPTDAPSDSS